MLSQAGYSTAGESIVLAAANTKDEKLGSQSGASLVGKKFINPEKTSNNQKAKNIFAANPAKQNGEILHTLDRDMVTGKMVIMLIEAFLLATVCQRSVSFVERKMKEYWRCITLTIIIQTTS